jgi:hypothetical protein
MSDCSRDNGENKMTRTNASIRMAVAALVLSTTLSAHAGTLESFTTAAGKTALPGKSNASLSNGKEATGKPRPPQDPVKNPTSLTGPVVIPPLSPAPAPTCTRPVAGSGSVSSPSDTCPPPTSYCDTTVTTVGDNYQVIRRGAQSGSSGRKAITQIPHASQSPLERKFLELIRTPWKPTPIQSGSPTLSNPPTIAQLDTYHQVNYMDYGDANADKYFIEFWDGILPINGKQVCAIKLTLKVKPNDGLFVTDQFKLAGIRGGDPNAPNYRYHYKTQFAVDPPNNFMGVFDYYLGTQFFPQNTFPEVEFSLWLNDLRPDRRGTGGRMDIVGDIRNDKHLGMLIQDDTKVIYSTLEYWLK